MLGGIWLHSVALVADAVHNVSDGVAVGIALAAASLALRGAAGTRTFGWGRVEILAALVNGLTLVGLGVADRDRGDRAPRRPAGGAGRRA